jgi:Transglutaminase-like superfamily
MSPLLKLWHLAPAERRLVLGAAVLMGGVRVGLSLLTFGRLQRILTFVARGHVKDPIPAARIAWAIAAAGRRVPGATCLVQALAAQVLLARHGHVAELRIGMARATEGIEAHAWLERDGEPIFGEPDRLRHTVFPLHQSRTS